VRGFDYLEADRAWPSGFVQRHNVGHRHSGIRYLISAQPHSGEDHTILAARHALYAKARAHQSAHWMHNTRDWSPITTVTLNPERKAVLAKGNMQYVAV
jgi:putative transposase